MKRLFFLSFPAMMLTVLFVSQPPRNAEGQPKIESPQDTARRKPILQDSIDLARELDSNQRILTEIQGNVQKIKKGVNELVKEKRNEQKRLAATPGKKDTVRDTTRVAYPVRVPVPVEVVDSEMVGKTWFGQMIVHVSRCRIKYIFHPKKWGKGKF